jgi:ABC-2 type transport system permease protein
VTATPPPPAAPAPPPPAPSDGAGAPPGTAGAPLPSPFLAVIGYTLRACLPAKRWWGVLLPCALAIMFGFLALVPDTTTEKAFEIVAELGLFGLVLPLTCVVVGDAVMGADLRAGTFAFTWLSPVSFVSIVVGRWLGGWLVVLVTVVPALVAATLVAGVPEGAGPMAVAAAAGSAAYIALFVMLGATARRSAVWALAIVFLGERLLGGYLAGIAQISPMWEAQQVYAGLAEDAGGWRLLREGTPNGWAAVVRLAAIALVCLAVAAWRMGHLKPTGGDE